MIGYQIKLVPDSEPNHDGWWVDVNDPPPRGERSWLMTEQFYRPFIPKGYHMVAIQTLTGR